MTPLTILIPSHNGLVHLKRCLPSVHRHAPAGTQILLVDDASTDGTQTWVAQHWPQVEVLRLAQNLGFCGAVNAGLAAACGALIELLNSDTEVEPGWAEPCLEHFADPSVGSVAPLVLVLDEEQIIDSAGVNYHRCGWAQARGYRHRVGAQYLQPCEVFGASGSSGFYRTALLRKLGGLRPEYDAYLEDVDLAFQLRAAGYRCLYEPRSRVHHRGAASYGCSNPRVAQLLSRNEEFTFWMNLPPAALALGLLPHLGFQAVRLVRSLLRGQVAPFVRGKLDALRHARQILERRRELSQRGELWLSDGWEVLRAGWQWLTKRQIA